MKIAMLDGDGIGPEICAATRHVLSWLVEALSLPIEIEVLPCGLSALASHGTTFPEETYRAAEAADGVILGPLSTMEYSRLPQGGVNASAKLRQDLNLYGNVRPSRSFAGVPAACPGLDVVIVRENTEGFYAVRTLHAGSGEFCPDEDTAFALRKITALASRRVARLAFELASTRPRRRLTVVHKVNVLKLTDGLFLKECRALAAQFPQVIYDEELVDAVAARIVHPDSGYDVLLTTNLMGDILSNEAAALAGGLGLGGSLNIGDGHAVAQAAHGSAPDIAGEDRANPTSLIVSTAMLLEWLGQRRHSPSLTRAGKMLASAVEQCLANPLTRTSDVGGSASTTEVRDAIVATLNQALSSEPASANFEMGAAR